MFADAEEAEVDQLRRRLEETERAMERIVAQIGTVTDKLSPTLVAEMLAQSQPLPDQEEKVRFSIFFLFL